MGHVNSLIPREDRAEVQGHLDSFNKILPMPDLTQVNVVVTTTAGTASYTLDEESTNRVVEKCGYLVSHQVSSPTSAQLPALAPKVVAAMAFFNLPLPLAPTGGSDVEDLEIERP